uniref:RING-type domain-containing protein n=1 Tax=Phaeomonas parva TaxID=124430 RepID=A0A7S1UKC2_9STRA|mmetsp:Transcript_6408/g.18051  ORF Transcript_6408/g.18051 Transcript_6408/m.18051 type:complete len:444 (+) Transcript_6408:107-1438(+)
MAAFGGTSLDEELAAVREWLPAEQIEALRPDYISVHLQRTRHNRIKAKLTPPEDYPETHLTLTLESPALPPPLLRKLTHQCEAVVAAAGEGPQVMPVLRHLHNFLCGNRFTTCWREVRRAAQLVTDHGGRVGLDEANGIVTMRVEQRGYGLTLRIEIPEAYPDVGAGFEVVRHTFPEAMMAAYSAQAEDAVRKCVGGQPWEDALRASNPIRGPGRKGGGSDGTPTVRVTNEHMRSLKHDVRFLKKVTDLRQVNARRENRNGTLVASAQDRRSARRTLSRLQKKEGAADEAYEKKMQELEAREEAIAAGLSADNHSDDAQPSLSAVVGLLVRKLVLEIPGEECQACGELAFPESPAAASLSDDTAPMRPCRVFCGHYLHWDCLNRWLTEPPFVRSCTHCNRRIYHPDWPSDYKLLERAWANQQAREREINDVSDFLGVDERFQA